MIDNINENTNQDDTLSNFDVTSHTAGMWKYNPIPEIPEPHTEYSSAYENSEYAEIIGARVRGKKHKHEGTNCDDWFEYRTVKDTVIAVVSDGAGSKELSRIGAKKSCIAGVDYLENQINSLLSTEAFQLNLAKGFDSAEFISECSKLAGVMQTSVEVAFNGVQSAFLKRKNKNELIEVLGKVPDLKDFSSTYLAAVLIPVLVNGTTEHFVISIQIGDGMIASVNADADFSDALRILGNADSGGFAGETEFLTSDSARSVESLKNHTKIGRRRISSLMLMSDGVADDYYPSSPEILRLYLDLQLNNIIGECGFNKGTASEYKGKIPKPVSYPWVNDSDVSYALQYAKNIFAETDLTLEKAWGKNDILDNAALKYFDTDSYTKDKTEMLSIWLDNYVERGSFDDRTLVIINPAYKK